MKNFSQILQEITGGIDPMCTVSEIAGVVKAHEQTVYSWKNDGTEPRYSQIVILSHYLVEQHNYKNLAMQLWPPCKGIANGKVKDDLLHIYEYGTDLGRAFRGNNEQEARKAFYRMKAEMEDLEKEIEQKWG